jgi:uncharacterized protein YqeY
MGEGDMALRDIIQNDLKSAMRAGDAVKRDTIRLLVSAINRFETDQKKLRFDELTKKGLSESEIDRALKERPELSDEDVLKVVTKEVKQRRESIDAFTKGNRPDLVAKEQAELEVLQIYLPAQLDRAALTEALRAIIREVDAHGPADKPKVMKRATAELRGRADGQEINKVVTELLAGG